MPLFKNSSDVHHGIHPVRYFCALRGEDGLGYYVVDSSLFGKIIISDAPILACMVYIDIVKLRCGIIYAGNRDFWSDSGFDDLVCAKARTTFCVNFQSTITVDGSPC